MRAEQMGLALIATCTRCYDDALRSCGFWPFVADPEAALLRCRALLGDAPRKTTSWQRFSYISPRWPAWALADPLWRYFSRFSDVFERGRLTWGCTVQANSALFERGRDDAPGEVVFVADPRAPVDLVELRAVADALFSLKGTDQPDPIAARVSAYLADELERVFGLAAPSLIHDVPPCALSTVYFDRRHFPNRCLSQGAYPLLVLDELGMVAVLPSRYWSDELIAHWNTER